MKILVSGGTGFMGKRLIPQLFLHGHQITLLSRDVERAQQSFGFPTNVVAWSAGQGAPKLTGRFDAVIHLAGESLADQRWTEKRKKELVDSRVTGTRELVSAVSALPEPPAVFVSASAIGFYGDQGDRAVDESSSKGTGFLADICEGWEAELKNLPPKTRAVWIRSGMVLGEEGGALKKLLPLFRLGLGGPVGSGKQWVSWIHLDDLCELFRFALTHDSVRGPLNGVTPNPVTNQEFSETLGHAVEMPAVLKAPAFALKLAMGEMSEIVLASQKVVPARPLELGFTFAYPQLVEAFAEIVKQPGDLTLRSTQWVPRPVDEIFRFFSDEKNLERITPPWLNFQVVNKSTEQIQEGTLIDYRLKLRGMPLQWQSRIEEWKPPSHFIDVQTKGPYTRWEHLHVFNPVQGGTLMNDYVRYRLPVGKLGRVLGGRWIKRDLARVFGYRRKVIEGLFKE